ncbi:DoxX family protein [Dokdonella soli]|uniref:DoxX family protein n=1 Tax=Dokdonella soli TaxID=529810 RepID=A0ABN1ICN3_9GAMM
MSAFPSSRTSPRWVSAILGSRATWLLARIALTLPYWWSGIDKVLHPQAALAEVSGLVGASTPLPFYIVLLTVQLGGSLLVILDRWTWLGTGVLAVFTLIVTLIAHAFWKLDGAACFTEMNTFMEHLALIAGFVFAAMAAQYSRNESESNHR